MSDILIKGMEMPKERESFTVTIKYNGLVFDTETMIQVAEAQEVPPHGRLGDLDELYASLKKWLIQNRHSMTEATRVWIRGVLEGIVAAPTILPAEEDK